ncbi:tail completion protein gp17 [Alkaliphilus sp. B6464]|uniref:tail completion protein gp17 n=1 Tax=Alkaliphilus sp. B6464 TaxID=2731219 RepID=UPI001BA89401|nr:DUF3168 domain-containing protein [Alkaliphilus sp. B6464]QUH21078.1 DUF3168 domain-containing protein [Alkaliphilus sp. B6464]
MEQALRHELTKAIPELNNSIYPTNAPEGSQRPYLVYARINTKTLKTLEGVTDKENISYMFSIMATKYSDMVRVRKQVTDLLKDMAQRTIGIKNIFIEDIDINNIDESYEFNLGVNRGIIDFTIYY